MGDPEPSAARRCARASRGALGPGAAASGGGAGGAGPLGSVAGGRVCLEGSTGRTAAEFAALGPCSAPAPRKAPAEATSASSVLERSRTSSHVRTNPEYENRRNPKAPPQERPWSGTRRPSAAPHPDASPAEARPPNPVRGRDRSSLRAARSAIPQARFSGAPPRAPARAPRPSESAGGARTRPKRAGPRPCRSWAAPSDGSRQHAPHPGPLPGGERETQRGVPEVEVGVAVGVEVGVGVGVGVVPSTSTVPRNENGAPSRAPSVRCVGCGRPR